MCKAAVATINLRLSFGCGKQNIAAVINSSPSLFLIEKKPNIQYLLITKHQTELVFTVEYLVADGSDYSLSEGVGETKNS